MEFNEVIMKRYSCKKYSDRQVEAEKLTAILNAGRLAPTAKNLQEQHVYVIQLAEALAKIDAVTPFYGRSGTCTQTTGRMAPPGLFTGFWSFRTEPSMSTIGAVTELCPSSCFSHHQE